MRALTDHGSGHIEVDTHPDSQIEDPGDAIIMVSPTAICGSDLHIFDGDVPEMKIGHVEGDDGPIALCQVRHPEPGLNGPTHELVVDDVAGEPSTTAPASTRHSATRRTGASSA